MLFTYIFISYGTIKHKKTSIRRKLYERSLRNIHQENGDGYFIYVPDIDAYTEADSMYKAVTMARDLIGSYSLSALPMPTPSTEEQARIIAKEKGDELEEGINFSDLPVTLIDIDTEEYRKQLSTKSVKKNCTIPSWLNQRAEAAGLNFSKILQDALIQKLGL